MTEAHKPLDAALDLLVYVPVGLAVTMSEELPKLAAKGRSRVTTQLTMARVVGQFAVSRGRSLIEQRLEQVSSPPPRPAEPAEAEDDVEGVDLTYDELLGNESPNGSGRPSLRSVPDAPSRSTGAAAAAERAPASRPAAPAAPAPAVPAPAVAPAPAPAPSSAAGPDASSLAIPGYDSLSASQVVQRLAGLSKDELAAVGAYEEAHRGRRTILNRVGQLQGQ